MHLPSYFGQKLTGGAYASAGLNFQDISAIICFFLNLNRNDPVQSIEFETINDFIIHEKGKTISAQVKKRPLNVSIIKNILKDTYSDNKHSIMIIGTQYQNDLDQIIKKKNYYLNALNSDLDNIWKQNIDKEFNEELAKLDLIEVKDIFLQSEIYSFPEELADTVLFSIVWKWTEINQIYIDIPKFIDSLKVKIQILRSERGHLHIKDINEIVETYSIQSPAKKIIKELYDIQFIETSKILSILGETQKDILRPLEEKLHTADQMLKEKNYKEALNIYSSFATLFPKEDIFFQCALLNELLENNEDAIDYCDKILVNNPKHYEANYIKGTSLSSLKRYFEAINQFEQTLEYRKTPELYYNLALTYMFENEKLDKAIENYNLCLKLDESFTAAHLNISICYFETMNFKLSLYHINRAIQLNPDLYKPYAHKGELYRYIGLYEDAIAYFEECLERNNNNYKALLGIALSFAEQGLFTEATLHFATFFYYYYDDFFSPDDNVGKNVRLIDIGWRRTLFATVELFENNQLIVYINNHSLVVPLKNSDAFIFIGSIETSNDTSSILYPTVGKVFNNIDEFNQVIEDIKKTIELFQYFDKPLYVNFGERIEINIQEREKYILIEIIFDNKYYITGMTDGKSGGLEAFVDYFDKYGQCRIHLECLKNSEVFIIDSIKNVNIY